MSNSRGSILKELWNKYRCDTCEKLEDVGDYNNPITIFGFWRKSNKRVFFRKCIVLDIRPFEMWDRKLEKDAFTRLTWLDNDCKNNLAILFECEDKSRIMGIITPYEYKKYTKLKIGDKLIVRGVFEYMKVFREQDVFLIFRIKNWIK